MNEIDPNLAALDLIQRAVQGDARAMRQLVRDLTPVIRAGVGCALARVHAARGRERQQEVEDVTQTVLLSLFADRARVLLQWDPARGLDLRSFVALLARRETVSLLRNPRRSPWTEDPTLQEDLDRNAIPRMGPESEAISRDMLAALSEAMRARLSARGAEIFNLMFIDARSVEEVATITGLTTDAVYTWKSRIARQLRELFVTFARTPTTIPPPIDGFSPMHDLPAARAKRAPGRDDARPVTGAFPKITRAKRAREEKRTKSGPMAIVPRAGSRVQPLRPPPLRARAGGPPPSSTPPPPSER